LPDFAARCRIVRCGSQKSGDLDFRLVPLFAGLCRPLLHPKGKKRATLRRLPRVRDQRRGISCR
jgi:hypothetical protein